MHATLREAVCDNAVRGSLSGRAYTIATCLAVACAPHPSLYRPPQGFVARAPERADVALALVVEGPAPATELDSLARSFETGVLWSFGARGYRPVLVQRAVQGVTDEATLEESLDRAARVLAHRKQAEELARARGLSLAATVRLRVQRVVPPFEGAARLVEGVPLRGDANYHVWASNELVAFSETQTAENWMPIVASLDAFGSGGTWFTYPHDVWARSMGRRLFRALPARAPLRAEHTEPNGFAVPSLGDTTELPRLRRDLSPELPGEETLFTSYQDSSGNALSFLSTNGVRWAVEVVPRRSHAYLLVDATCSGRPSELWPTTAEAPVPVPSCVQRR